MPSFPRLGMARHFALSSVARPGAWELRPEGQWGQDVQGRAAGQACLARKHLCGEEQKFLSGLPQPRESSWGCFQERTRHGGSGHPESPEREEGQSSACLSLGRGRSCLHPLCPVLHPGIRLILMALDLASSPRYVKAAPAAARAQAWAGGSCSSSQEGETGLARVAGAGSPRPLTSCSSRVWVPGGGREAGQEPWARPSAGVCEPASQIPGSIPTWLYCASVGRPWQCLVPPCLSFPI